MIGAGVCATRPDSGDVEGFCMGFLRVLCHMMSLYPVAMKPPNSPDPIITKPLAISHELSVAAGCCPSTVSHLGI